jgi:hypothetical protein
MFSVAKLTFFALALVQVASGSVVMHEHEEKTVQKLTHLPGLDASTYYHIIKDTTVTHPTLYHSRHHAEVGYKHFHKEVHMSFVEHEHGRTPLPHIIAALTTPKGTVLASIPFGETRDRIKKVMVTEKIDVFETIVDHESPLEPLAEHHAIFWAVKELKVTLGDLAMSWITVYGLDEHEQRVNSMGLTVPLMPPTHRRPCASSRAMLARANIGWE